MDRTRVQKASTLQHTAVLAAERRDFGVGRRLRHLESGFTSVNERRLTKIRIKVKFNNISLIGAHDPTEERDDAARMPSTQILRI